MAAAMQGERHAVQTDRPIEDEIRQPIKRTEIDHLDVIDVVFPRKPGGVEQGQTRHPGGGLSAAHRPAETGPMQLGQPAAMIPMRMRQHDELQLPGLERQPRRALGETRAALGVGPTVHHAAQLEAFVRDRLQEPVTPSAPPMKVRCMGKSVQTGEATLRAWRTVQYFRVCLGQA